MGTRILLADDHAMVRQGLKLLLQREGFDVVGEAADGQEAVRLATENCPDVAVLDYGMPVMNGLDAARQIRVLAPNAYILLFTLQAYPELVEDAQKVGVNKVLPKSGGAGTTVLGAVRSFLAA